MFKHKIKIFITSIFLLISPIIVQAAVTSIPIPQQCGVTISNGSSPGIVSGNIASLNNQYVVGTKYLINITTPLPFAIPGGSTQEATDGINTIYYLNNTGYAKGFTGVMDIIATSQTGTVTAGQQNLLTTSASGYNYNLQIVSNPTNTASTVNSLSGVNTFNMGKPAGVNYAAGTVLDMFDVGSSDSNYDKGMIVQLTSNLHSTDTTINYSVIETFNNPSATINNVDIFSLVPNVITGITQCVTTIVPATSNIQIGNPNPGVITVGATSSVQIPFLMTSTNNGFAYGNTSNLSSLENYVNNGTAPATIDSFILAGQTIKSFSITCLPYNPLDPNNVYGSNAQGGIKGGLVTLYDVSNLGNTIITSLLFPNAPAGGPYVNYASTTLPLPYTLLPGHLMVPEITNTDSTSASKWTNCTSTIGT